MTSAKFQGKISRFIFHSLLRSLVSIGTSSFFVFSSGILPTPMRTSCKHVPPDISGSNAEPLKRSESAEIRCVLMCHSEIERNCVFEAVAKVIMLFDKQLPILKYWVI